jgi:hypothetical protein
VLQGIVAQAAFFAKNDKLTSRSQKGVITRHVIILVQTFTSASTHLIGLEGTFLLTMHFYEIKPRCGGVFAWYLS